MIEILVMAFIFAIATANVSHVLTEIDLFERPREWLGNLWLIGKVFTCKFCMSDKLAVLSALCFLYLPDARWGVMAHLPLAVRIVVMWWAIHWIARGAHKLEDGVLVSAAANVVVNDQDSES